MITSIVALLFIVHLVVSAPVKAPKPEDPKELAVKFAELQNELQALNASVQALLTGVKCKFHFSTYSS